MTDKTKIVQNVDWTWWFYDFFGNEKKDYTLPWNQNKLYLYNMRGSFIMKKDNDDRWMIGIKFWFGAMILALCLIVFGIVAVSCDFGNGNKDMNDTENTFEKAIIITGNETTVVDVKEWCDYKDSDQVQIKTKDGTVYFGSSNNIILIHETWTWLNTKGEIGMERTEENQR